MKSMQLRPARDTDREGIIALIDRVYRIYGDRICLEGADKDLSEIPCSYRGGHFDVVADNSRIWATVALVPAPDRQEVGCLRRMYLDPDLWGSGWGPCMIEWVRERARDMGMSRLEFWSDTRFERAHAFYRKQGFESDGSTRTLDDAWEPYDEYFFSGNV